MRTGWWACVPPAGDVAPAGVLCGVRKEGCFGLLEQPLYDRCMGLNGRGRWHPHTTPKGQRSNVE